MPSQSKLSISKIFSTINSYLIASPTSVTMATDKSKVTWAHAWRDIGVAAVNRGQLLAFGLLSILAMIIWKMPGEQIGIDIDAGLRALKSGYMWGYIFWFATLVAWFVHGRFVIRTGYQEQVRIAAEKSSLQKKLGAQTGTTKK